VVTIVSEYPLFLEWMPSCTVKEETRQETKKGRVTSGSFDADTKIGFNAVNFTYLSKIRYSHPSVPILMKDPLARWQVDTLSDSTSIFKSMTSQWKIKPDPQDPLKQSIIDYKIEMEFASPLYAAVTSQFFDFLASNIIQRFTGRCAEVTSEGRFLDEIRCDKVEGMEAKDPTGLVEPCEVGEEPSQTEDELIW
jgi:ribosome-associated toxin RatA of RatAB toxin-antitoxin module